MPTKLRAVRADLNTLAVDAIVNAANTTLMGGGGVDGAIHRAAGRELVNECARLNGCHPGDAKITKGYKLPAKHVIHTVGPVWRDGSLGEATTLASCYRRALEVAREHNLRTIAFPCISTGVYGYPPDQAAAVAVNTVLEVIGEQPGAYGYPPDQAAAVAVNTVLEVIGEQPGAFEEITFCCFSESDLRLYDKLLQS